MLRNEGTPLIDSVDANEDEFNVFAENKKDISIPRGILSAVISAASVMFYVVTTDGENAWIVVSGVGSNFFINAYAADGSLIHFGDQWRRREICQLLFSVGFSVVLATPQTLIARHEAKGELMRIIAPTSTFLGTAPLNGLALKDLSAVFDKQAIRFQLKKIAGTASQEEITFRQNRATVLGNLELLQRAFALTPHYINSDDLKKCRELPRVQQPAAVLELIFERVWNNVHAPKQASAALLIAAMLAQYAVKVGFAASMVFSALAFTCATENTLDKDYSFSRALGFAGGLAMMMSTIMLCILGGFALGEVVSKKVQTLFQFGIIGNDLSKKVVFAAFFAAAWAIRSGYTAGKLDRDCDSSVLNPLMTLPGSREFADGSAGFFNWYFVTKCFLRAIATVEDRCSQKTIDEMNFDQVQNALQNIYNKAAVAKDQTDLDKLPQTVRVSMSHFRDIVWKSAQPASIQSDFFSAQP